MTKEDREMAEYLAGMLAYWGGFNWRVFGEDQYDAIGGWFYCSFHDHVGSFPDE